MITFIIDRHKRKTHEQVVEIWSNDRFIASLYGIEGECGVKLVSHHIPSPPDLRVEVRRDFPTALEVRFHRNEEHAHDAIPR